MIDKIYKRGRIYWWRYRRNDDRGKVQYISLNTSDKQAAEARRTDLLREREQEAAGILVTRPLRDAAQRSLSEHLQDLLADLAAQRCGEKHLANVEYRVGVLIQACGWKVAKDVTADSFQNWRKSQSLSAKTLNDYLEAARRLLNWMEKHGRVTGNALKTIEKISTKGRETRQRRAYSDDEMKRLLAVVPDDRKAVYLMAVYTGLRRKELAALRWSDIHLEAVQPFVSVRASTTKNGEPEMMRLHDDVVAALSKLKPEAVCDGDKVFARFPRIERLKRDLIKAEVQYKNGHGYADFHALRYTFCTNLGNADVSPAVRQALMRHSESWLTEKIYTDKRMLATWSAIEKLPSYTTGLSQGLSQNLDANGLGASSAVIGSVGAHGEKVPVNIGGSHLVSVDGTSGHDGKIGGSDGARSRHLLRFH